GLRATRTSSSNAARAFASSAATAPANGVAANCPGTNASTEAKRITRIAIAMRTSRNPAWRRRDRTASASPRAHTVRKPAATSRLTCRSAASPRGRHVRVVLNGAPHTEPKPSLRHQHPVHLPERREAVRKELQPLLTEHNIERGARKG